MSAPRITKSQSKPLVPSLGRGWAPSTSTLMVPSDVPSAPSASHTSNASVPHDTGATESKYGGVTSAQQANGRSKLMRYDSCHPSTTF
jgi:hypothetical protein